MKPHKSLISLILTNLVPILGVVFLDWDIYLILFLFWFETIVLLGCGLARTVLQGKQAGAAAGSDAGEVLSRYFMLVWGGGFTLIHGVFVVFMIGPLLLDPSQAKIHSDGSGFSFQPSPALIAESLGSLLNLSFLFGILTVLLLHAINLYSDWKKQRLAEGSSSYIGRIILLHITMIIGALVTVLKQLEHGMIYVFVGLKFAIDLLFYWMEKSDGTETSQDN